MKAPPVGHGGMVTVLMGIVMIFIAKDGWHLTWDVGLLHVCASTIAGTMYILLQKPMLKNSIHRKLPVGVFGEAR